MRNLGGSLGLLAAIAAGLVVGGVFGVPLLAVKDDRGLLLVCGGPAVAAAAYRLIRGRPAAATPRRGSSGLAAAAALSGPLVGAGLGAICLLAVPDAHPADRLPIVTMFAVLGGIAGVAVAAAVVVGSLFGAPPGPQDGPAEPSAAADRVER